MERKSQAPSKPKKAQTREDRLKAALKANMGRRKAQARARAEKQPGPDEADSSKGQD
ncbi:hypothetical protein [Shimia abyssi]|uniref:Uncharacterized protein n=1 Tax=Shimia abyssi TaxID=1662395 RepID=A0A2P8FAD7_9RHOB|nr:hypothetical protein [Shimia abyssi]PSL18622.1 hypothetical protein CLV88_1097 [Shimia abyssi]